ncbi:MAG: hypothetical protein IPH34_12130 [Chitinophagaceae bacterium]|nr:hypothetical protein [Chitinophagaceae bacterium]MBK8607447.1 hypothetical protein [Chitinophagaceae bacterium]MBP6234286.1 hypothetical protein [Chitinophagaceae bacterium]MBP6477834.1 hypothetical protein [Chitinophagaceae bacterium]HQV55971.1 hypothetical protein [Chitinophagaceae bacterium]
MKNIATSFIVLEVLVGLIGGILYINKPELPEYSLSDSILNFYIILNGIFFGSTILFGTVSSILLKKTNRLIISVLLSLAAGIFSLILHAIVFPIPIFAFFSLFGFILGFNLYLLKEPFNSNNKKSAG